MHYDFDEIIDRRGTGSYRWSGLSEKYGEPELIPLTTADMGFRTAQPVLDAIRRQAEYGIYGYAQPLPSYYEAVARHIEERSGWSIERSWIAHSPGIVSALSFCVQSMTEPGDGVAIMSPVYPPFSRVAENNGRQARRCPLRWNGDRPEIDFDLLGGILAEESTKMLLFCNPHNPIGRVWTHDEVRRVAQLCLENGVILASDEIHCDIVFGNARFTSAGSVMAELGGLDRVVVCTAASKTFNIPGLQCSAIIIPGAELRKKYEGVAEKRNFLEPNAVGMAATEAAYTQGGEWYEQVMAYLEQNRDFAAEYINTRIAPLHAMVPEATYLMWIDCRALGMSDGELEQFFAHRAKAAFNPGGSFGPEGTGFVRMNLAEPRAVLARALEGMEKAVRELRDGE